jgi:hypothetical protein
MEVRWTPSIGQLGREIKLWFRGGGQAESNGRGTGGAKLPRVSVFMI